MKTAVTDVARCNGFGSSGNTSLPLVAKVHDLTDPKTGWQETTVKVVKLNRALCGWANYFQVGSVTKAYRAVDSYTAPRLRQWLRDKYKVKRRKGGIYPLAHLYGH